ncbi:MAG: hypothetical protein GY839_00520 [candidate division Zixibacteria bacterium]|nr:hypothetical protein [candidate division Zixibacteria bacterium]
MTKYKKQVHVIEPHHEPTTYQAKATNLTDREIVEEFLNKAPSVPNRDIENELYRRLARGICKGVSSIRLDVNHQDYEDIVGDAMECALRNIYSWSRKGKLFSWCYTIGRNKALDFLKRFKNATIPFLNIIDKTKFSNEKDNAFALEKLIPDSYPDEEHVVLAREFFEQWEKFLIVLPSEAQSIIIGLMEGKYKSITDAGNAFNLYPYEVRKIISPHLKPLKKLLSLNQATWDAVRRLNGFQWLNTPIKTGSVLKKKVPG